MPPVPAAVMMCDRAKEVTEMSDRVPVGVPRSVEPSASHESSIDLQAMRVGDRADAVPVGHVPDQVRDEDRARARPDHRLDRVDVDVVGVGFDVDEHRDETGADDRRDVGGERDRGGDDLVAGLAARAARPRDTAPTNPSCTSRPGACRTARRRACSKARTFLPMRSACGPPRSTATTASISRSSCTLPA